MAQLDLYVDTYARKFVTGPTNPAPFTIPDWIQGDTVTLHVYLLARTTRWPASFVNLPAYSIIGNSDLSLKLGIGSKSGVGTGDLVTQQFTWDKDATNSYFYADLALNTAAINTALASETSVTKWLEIEYTQSGYPSTVIQQQTIIQADVLKNASVAVPAGQTAMTAEDANATFLKKDGSNDVADSKIWRSPDGTKRTLQWLDNDGNMRFDPIT